MRKPLILLTAAAVAAGGATSTAVASGDGHHRAGHAGKHAAKGARHVRPATYTIPGDKVFPEGIARKGSTFFVGSTTDGTIFRGSLKSPAMTTFSPGGTDGRTTATGMKVAGSRLVVAGAATGKIFVLSAKDGRTLKVLDTEPAGAPTFLNDVVIARGYAYVTDSQRPILFRFKVDDHGAVGPLERFVDFTGTPFAYGTGFNANGIAEHHGILTIVQSSTGKLFRVDTKTKEVSEIALGGATLPNGDGLLRDGNVLYVVRNAQELIVPVRLSKDGRSGLVGTGVTGPQLQYPTTIAQDGRRLLVVNSQFDRRSAGAAPELPFTVATIRAPKVVR